MDTMQKPQSRADVFDRAYPGSKSGQQGDKEPMYRLFLSSAEGETMTYAFARVYLSLANPPM